MPTVIRRFDVDRFATGFVVRPARVWLRFWRRPAHRCGYAADEHRAVAEQMPLPRLTGMSWPLNVKLACWIRFLQRNDQQRIDLLRVEDIQALRKFQASALLDDSIEAATAGKD